MMSFTCGSFMKLLALFAITFLLHAPGYAQYQSVFGKAESEAGTGGIIQASDGNFISVGWTTSLGNDSDVYVVKSDLCGKLIWARSYDIGGHDEGSKIRQTNDGGFIIAGSTENRRTCCYDEDGFNFEDGFLLKIDAKGEVLWARTYGGRDRDHLHDVQLVPGEDGFYLAGRSASFGAGKYDGWLMQVTDLGKVVWSRTYGEWSRDGVYSLAVGKDSALIAVGESVSYTPVGTGQDIFIIKVRATDGTPIWTNYYRPAAGHGYVRSIVLAEEKGLGTVFYAAGNIYGSSATGQDAYILKGDYDDGTAIADVAIHHQIFANNNDVFNEIQTLPDGNVVAVGTLGPAVLLPNFNYDAYVAVLNPALAILSQKTYGGPLRDEGWSVAVGINGTLRYTLMMLGLTNNFGAGEYDLYQVYATSVGYSGCNEYNPSITKTAPGLVGRHAEVRWAKVWVECPAKVVVNKDEKYKVLCTSCITLDDQPASLEMSDGGLSRLSAPEAATGVERANIRTDITR